MGLLLLLLLLMLLLLLLVMLLQDLLLREDSMLLLLTRKGDLCDDLSRSEWLLQLQLLLHVIVVRGSTVIPLLTFLLLQLLTP